MQTSPFNADISMQLYIYVNIFAFNCIRSVEPIAMLFSNSTFNDINLIFHFTYVYIYYILLKLRTSITIQFKQEIIKLKYCKYIQNTIKCTYNCKQCSTLRQILLYRNIILIESIITNYSHIVLNHINFSPYFNKAKCLISHVNKQLSKLLRLLPH